MKLVINIPCYNEEKTLPLVLKEIPASIPNISKIIVQVVDDGSTDSTAEVAAQFGCDLISHPENLGLGRAFQSGVDSALTKDCQVFVNLDADHQYSPRDIVGLIEPIMAGNADIVIGDRQPWKLAHFSLLKRFLQWAGNWVIRRLLNIDSPDAVSGFRAYSRAALENLHVTTNYSYTLDTLVQAAHKGLRIKSLIVQTNPPTRKSRLSANVFQYMALTMLNFARVMFIYEPGKIFVWGVFPLLLLCILFAVLVFLFLSSR